MKRRTNIDEDDEARIEEEYRLKTNKKYPLDGEDNYFDSFEQIEERGKKHASQ